MTTKSTEGKKIMVLNKTQWKFRKQAQEQFPDAIIIKDKPMKSKSSEGKKEIIKFKKQSGTTLCNQFCGYFSGHPSEHTCGKPIYETAYKCPFCDRWAWTEKQIKQHLSIKHKL